MNIVNHIISLSKTSMTLFKTIVSFLFAKDDDKDHPSANGSHLFGEHNFRTGGMDFGADPDGWYEEDL